MERIGEESVANGITGNTELKRKECNIALKPEGHNILELPIIFEPLRSDWPKSSLQNFSDTLEAKDLNRCVTSMVGSEPPCTSPSSMNNAGVAVEELTVGKFRAMNSALVSSPSSSRQDQWQHLHQLACGSGYRTYLGDSMSQGKDRVMLRVREQYMKMTFDIKSPNFLLRKPIDQGPEEISPYIRDIKSPNFLLRKPIDQGPEEISPYIRARDNMITSSNTMPIVSTQLKTSSTSGFSRLFVKKTLKGKGVITQSTEARKEFGIAVAGQNDEKLGFVTKVASDSLHKSSANGDLLLSHRINRPVPESFGGGICLREWLKPGYRKREKAESMHIFRHIVELVDSAQSEGLALRDLQPSYIYLWPLNRVIYTGLFVKRESKLAVNQDLNKKRRLEQHKHARFGVGAKQKKLSADMKPQSISSCSSRIMKPNDIDFYVNHPEDCGYLAHHSSYQSTSTTTEQKSFSAAAILEEKWYSSPEELNDSSCYFSSNIYGLGVLLFELLCDCDSSEVHFAVMSKLRHRILPSDFLSENPKEAGFCLWLLHPEPLSRPTTREILQSELICKSEKVQSGYNLPISTDDDEADSEILLHFLDSLKEQKQKHASKLVENIRCLEEDIKEVEERYFRKTSSVFTQTHNEYLNASKQSLRFGGPVTSPSQSFSMPNMNEERLMRNISQLENAYFFIRSQIRLTETSATGHSDKDLLMNRDRWPEVQNKNEESNSNQKSVDHLGTFFEGLCKFTRYSRFEVCGTLGNGDLLNSANVICSLSFDRDEEYIAAAGASKRIKIFEFNSLLNDSIDIHYPAVEMSNKSKLSCVCWNNYIKNYLASTDYDGVVQIWDAGTGQGFSQYTEHLKRAWSIDFSQMDPTKFASGSDDCSVKLWSINEKSSGVTIGNPANVCCVQFSAFSSHLLAFGSADYKVYCYDLRNTRIPWCILAGHDKAVSYVKFLDSETLVSASTDNTLKLWDLRKSSPAGLSCGACSLTFRGHTNEKNFVGLSVSDGYIACGSETNEVYSYYRSLPMPITSYKFGSIDPFSGHEIGDDNGQFVSSVCWRQKSNMIVAANSSGCIKLLRMVQ